LAGEIFKEMDDALKEKDASGTKVVGFGKEWVISAWSKLPCGPTCGKVTDR